MGTVVDVGNPHLVDETFSPDRLVELGPRLEHHAAFPNRTNVEKNNRAGEMHLASLLY
jgi:diaminopimelate epimerase